MSDSRKIGFDVENNFDLDIVIKNYRRTYWALSKK